MKNIKTVETYRPLTDEQIVVEQIAVFKMRRLPKFPLKHVHSAFVNLRDARQAAFALLHAGFDARYIHVLESREYVEAVSQGQSPLGFLTSVDYDVYVQEANKGRAFLVIHSANYTQLKQIREILALHHALIATYIDRWTQAELLS